MKIAENWRKVEKSDKKWGKVGKSNQKCGKVAKKYEIVVKSWK